MVDLKSAVISTHRWLGLGFGVLVIWLALSGAWLVFRPQAAPLVDRYLTQPSTCATPRPLDDLKAIAAEAYPVSPVASVWLTDDPRASTMLRYGDSNQIYIDGCNGRVLGMHQRYSGIFGFAEYLHRFRFFPTHIAEWISGTGAVIMAFGLALLGLYAWWPRRRAAIRPSMTLNPALSGRARSRNQHTVFGAAASLVLLVVAGTGIPQAFKPVENALFTISGSHEIKKPKPKVAGAVLGPRALETAWRSAVAEMGRAPRKATVRVPEAGKTIEMYVNEYGAPHSQARTYFYADPTSGAIVRHIPWAKVPAGEQIYNWLLALHMGMVGGLFGQLVTLAAMLVVPVLGYTGLRSWWLKRRKLRYAQVTVAEPPMAMRVAAVRDEAAGVRSFHLIPVSGGPLPPFKAGDHLEISLADGPTRQYSICNGPNDRTSFEVAVRLLEDGRGGSAAMHRLVEGDVVRVSRPKGHFPLHLDAPYTLLVAAGIGVTPLLSMARHLAEAGRPYRMLYFGRDRASTAYLGHLAREAAAHTEIHIGVHRSAIRETIAQALDGHPSGTQVYTCGPAAFMDTVLDIGRAAGLDEDALHREYFAADERLLSAPRGAFNLTLARTNRVLAVAETVSILDVLEANGICVPSSCEQGICGNCLTRVVSGDIDHRDNFLSSEDKARGDCMLICVSRVKQGELILDV